MQEEVLDYGLRKLEKQNEDILDELRELKKDLPNRYISKEVYKAEVRDLARRVELLENNASRVTWAILGAAGSILLSIGKTILGM